MLPAGGRRYFFKKETKKSDQAQGVSVVLSTCLVVLPGMHERGDGGSWTRPGCQKGEASGRGVCVCGSRDRGCNLKTFLIHIQQFVHCRKICIIQE